MVGVVLYMLPCPCPRPALTPNPDTDDPTMTKVADGRLYKPNKHISAMSMYQNLVPIRITRTWYGGISAGMDSFAVKPAPSQ